MPELIEVEFYRRAAMATVGHRIEAVLTADPLTTTGATSTGMSAALRGREILDARRHGKLLVLDLDGGASIGLHFGMTGRLIVGDHAPIERLEYGATHDDPRWDRFVLVVEGIGHVRMNDPRRLGRVVIDPHESSLGPDAATVTSRALAAALDSSRTALKARLLDQSRIAGIGNLLADEILWRARLAPVRPAGSLGAAERTDLARRIRSTIGLLTRRGGSHTGDLQDHRRPASRCPRCHHPLRHDRVGGRSTYWCPYEQR